MIPHNSEDILSCFVMRLMPAATEGATAWSSVPWRHVSPPAMPDEPLTCFATPAPEPRAVGALDLTAYRSTRLDTRAGEPPSFRVCPRDTLCARARPATATASAGRCSHTRCGISTRPRRAAPCEAFRSKIGPLIFEFSTFHKHEFEHGRDFVAALDQFFEALPQGWEYGVEIRNKTWLAPEYFAMLRSHGVAHVFNNWNRMPSVGEQLAMEGSETADFNVSRFLLKPGRTYEASVKQFSPYKEMQDRVDEARTAAEKILEASFVKKKRGYLYVNNRLEGCAPMTIAAVLERLAPLRDGRARHPIRRWRADFAHVESRTLIEIEGGIYVEGGGRHNRSAGFIADAGKYLEAFLAGWNVVRLTEAQITAPNMERIIRRVAERTTF